MSHLSSESIFKKAPIIHTLKKRIAIITPFQKFLKKMVSGSFPLMIAACSAIIWANLSPESYHTFRENKLSIGLGHFHIEKSLAHWIDEALMALFFFSVGLEIKREVMVGELASMKKAMLPVMAGIGGMVLPALIYTAFNYNLATSHGWGIPMATDIAFSLAILAILGKRIPVGVRIFLTALAIADDLGAVMVIGLFYTKAISINYLFTALFFLGALLIANLLWVRWTIVYAILGILMWFAILKSGIHATVAGVLVALFIPASGKYDTQTFIDKVKAYLKNFECGNTGESEDDGNSECGYTILLNKTHLNSVHNIEQACHEVETPLQRLEYGIHSWVSYLILPLFALANAGVVLKGIPLTESLMNPVALGIIFGLVFGKPIGILLFTWISVKVLKTNLHKGVYWSHLIGASILAGIGFTMSLFIAGLSFDSPQTMEIAKLGIIIGSIVSAVLGLGFLLYATKREGVRDVK
ncbi:MAG: Na+/H+ antiporter NhaA [Proteobacteria bacterium]|nr:Na+/H+ antiporter NhaA [Pseudomonadota bacterium]